MNGNIPGWDFNTLSPFSWMAARNVINPSIEPAPDDDSYLDESWYGDYSLEEERNFGPDDPRLR